MAPLSEDASDDAITTSARRRDSQRDRTFDNTTRKEDSDRNRDKRRVHRSASNKNTTKASSSSSLSSSSSNKSKSNTSSKRGSVTASSREASNNNNTLRHHRRTLSNRSTTSSSTSDSDEEDIHGNGNEVVEDHRAVLAAARGRLTSPSLLSTLTSLTTATNNSGGSSGSNSTVTQASMSRRSRPEPVTVEDAPMSPAVPDPPDVFAFLEKDSPPCSDEEAESKDYVPANWPHPSPSPFARPSTPDDAQLSRQRSTSSSASSSFHSDASELHENADNETDRSTSPERSVKSGDEEDTSNRKSQTKSRDNNRDSTSTLNPDPAVPTSPAAAKFAAQMLAAQHRQSLHNSLHQAHQGHPSYPHVYNYPYPPQQPAQPAQPQLYPPYAIQNPPSAPFQHFAFNPSPSGTQLAAPVHLQRRIAKAKGKSRHVEKVPERSQENEEREVSGYEALASALSSTSTTTTNSAHGNATIQPLYRRFGSLNHRYLLYLQDELSELEDSLRLLDSADASLRTTPNPSHLQSGAVTNTASAERQIFPASRRVPRDRELEYHRSALLARIGAKLAQYNTALTAFHGLENSLPSASASSISSYRDFVAGAGTVVQAETKFLEYASDLVAVSGTGTEAAPRQSYGVGNGSMGLNVPRSSVTALAVAVTAAVLLPVLTFTVIPGFLGRMVVALLVAGGVLGSLVQSGLVGAGAVMRNEGVVVAGVFIGVMGIVAGVVG